MKGEFQKGNEKISIELTRSDQEIQWKGPSGETSAKILRWEPPAFSIQIEDKIHKGYCFARGEQVDIHLPEGNFRLRWASNRRGSTKALAGGLISPMPGRIIKVMVKRGERVKSGDLLMILEAMKMEHKILSPRDGTIQEIHFKEGDRVAQEVELLKMENES